MKILLIFMISIYSCTADTLYEKQYVEPPGIRVSCGRSYFDASQTQMIYGSDAVRGSYPFAVLIITVTKVGKIFSLEDKKKACGGSLLNSKWVLTARHCLRNQSLDKMEFRIGIHTFPVTTGIDEIDAKNGVIRKLKRYEELPGEKKSDDVAIVLLDKEVKFSHYIQPICLPPKGANAIGRRLRYATWGKTQTGGFPKVLQQMSRVVSGCPWNWKDKKLLCSTEGPASSCEGDSGSASFQHYNFSNRNFGWTIFGIHLGAVRKTRRNTPEEVVNCTRGDTVYEVKVDSILEWIEEIAFWNDYNPFPGECGRGTLNLPEVGLTENVVADQRQFPFVVTVVAYAKAVCSAVVLNRYWILTTAQCVLRMTPGISKPHVRWIEILEGVENVRHVQCNIHMHPEFNFGYRPNDIALLKVIDTGISFNQWIQPVCLPKRNITLKDEEIIYYFDRLSNHSLTWTKIVKDPCVYNAPVNTFCSKKIYGITHSSNFSVGSPIFHRPSSKWVLMGLVSSQDHINNKAVNHVYATLIPEYVDWITNKNHLSPFLFDCGWRNMTTNGIFENYPFLVAIQDRLNGDFSQGALLSEQWVVTIAHFFVKKEFALHNITAYLGVNNLTATATERNFISLFLHPHFEASLEMYDIALAKLNEPVQYSAHIAPICLPTLTHYTANKGVYYVGWILQNNQTSFNAIRSQEYLVRDTDKCNTENHIPGDSICFDEVTNTGEFVTGSGGLMFALQLHGTRLSWSLLGITSKLSQDKEYKRYLPLIATSLRYYQDWILDSIDETPKQPGYCGQSYKEHEINDGEAKAGSFPFIVLLRIDAKPVCGGTIIDNYWILSSASCIKKYNASQIDVVAGSHTLDSNFVTIKVKELFKHPKFEEKSGFNDIVVMKLTTPLNYSDRIQPACYPRQLTKYIYREWMMLAGWSNLENLTVNNVMKQNFIKIYICPTCSISLQGLGRHLDGNLGGPMFTKSLQHWHPEITSWTVYGIVSRVKKTQYTALEITEIYPHITWIEEIIHNIVTLPKKCGLDYVSSPSSYIFHGKSAVPGQFPFMVDLSVANDRCGATLFHEEWVLTSASCIKEKATNNIFIHLGAHTISTEVSDSENRKAAAIYIHPNYDTTTNENDIALIKLSSPVTFNKIIQPICLPTEDELSKNPLDMFIPGWSIRQDTQSQDLEYEVARLADCAEKQFSNKTFCFAAVNKSTHPCDVDFGGPAAIKIPTENGETLWTLVGVLSNKQISCQSSEQQSVRAVKVEKFLKWITTVTTEMKINYFEGECGQSLFDDTTQYILNGTETSKGKYPFMVLLVAQFSHKCGAALIHARWVLTSALCLEKLVRTKWTIRVQIGFHYIWFPYADGSVESRTSELHFHPNYYHEDILFQNDIALIKLMKEVKFNGLIQPICLPNARKSYAKIGNVVNIAGWGEINENTPARQIMETKLEVRYCDKRQQSGAVSSFCLTKGPGTSRMYDGDYGGPVFSREQKEVTEHGSRRYGWFISGIISPGPTEGGQPIGMTLATNVSAYTEWIENTKKTSEDKVFCGQSYVNEEENTFNRSHEAVPNSFPFIALLHDATTYAVGTIISEWWIITSARYISTAQWNETLIRLAAHDMLSFGKDSVLHRIRSVFYHHDFVPKGNDVPDHLAMIRVATSIQFNEKVQPACIQGGNDDLKDLYVFIAGWYSSKDETGNEMNLMQVRLPFKQCPDSKYHKLLCVDSGREPFPYCNMMGTPFFMKTQVHTLPSAFGWKLLGIISKDSCGEDAAALQISEYRSWIFKVMNDDYQYPDPCGMSFVPYTDFSINPNAGSIPFAVSIRLRGQHLCSGALLVNDWVVTAGSCVLVERNICCALEDLTVALGTYNLLNNYHTKIMDVLDVHAEPPVDNLNHQFLVALLKIGRVQLNDHIQPICLFSGTVDEITSSVIFGWGRKNGEPSDWMLQIPVNNDGKHVFGETYSILSFRNRDVEYLNDTCVTDLGSPIAISAEVGVYPGLIPKRLWKLVGISLIKSETCDPESGIPSRNLTFENNPTRQWMTSLMKGNPHPKGNCGTSIVPVEERRRKTDNATGGVQAKKGSWPWLASIQHNLGDGYRETCVGSLVSRRTILTSARCVRSMKTEKVTVLLGVHEILGKQQKSNLFDVYVIFLHPKSRHYSHEYNIAVVVLKKLVNFTRNIQPICLPWPNFKIQTNAKSYFVTYAGLHNIAYNAEEKKKQTRVSLISWEKCNSLTGEQFQPSHEDICADFSNVGCMNERGQPLCVEVYVNKTFSYWLLYGIASRSSHTCHKSIPPTPITAFKVQNALIWITDVQHIFQ